MSVEMVDSQAHAMHGLVILDKKGDVWYTFARPWWDVLSWLWWCTTPRQKKWIQLRQRSGTKTRIRVVRMARRYITLG